LPNKFGIGKLGRSAFDFVDFLEKSDVKCWQVLPLSPTSYGDSPYQSPSAFAGNPYFIDFDTLRSEGILKKSDYESIKWQDNNYEVNYPRVYGNCYKVLKSAYKNYKKDISNTFFKFINDNKDWLNDYALFMAIKAKNGGRPWTEWDKKVRNCDPDTLKTLEKELEKEIGFQKFMQYKFYRQWTNLKKYANDKGISIIGDIPIYVAYDSVEVWKNPEMFQLDKNKLPVAVAGCPPDDFSPTGQLWGNPLYNWTNHKKTGYEWWIRRLKWATEIYDTVRIDHFRGFESYYSIPYGNETAEDGEWEKGPGTELFEYAEKKLGKVNVIAEDLGFITPEVQEMLDKVGYPGMKVLQFGFDNPKSEYLPHNYTTSNLVCYTGTHDNYTLKGWLQTLKKSELEYIQNL
jgi:4-alpha-glucanotransferase